MYILFSYLKTSCFFGRVEYCLFINAPIVVLFLLSVYIVRSIFGYHRKVLAKQTKNSRCIEEKPDKF